MKDISKRIKELREEHNMSQTELAEKLFVTRQAVSNWETKKTRPDIETLEAISKVFGIELTELLYGKEKDEAEYKHRLIQVYIFGSCTLLAVFLNIFVMPIMKDWLAHYYRFELYLPTVVAICVLSGCAAPFVFSLLSFSTDIYIKNNTVRKILLGIGIFLVAIYTFSFLSFLLISFDIIVLDIQYRLSLVVMYCTKAFYFIITGMFLYLGLKKGNAQR